MLILDKLTTLQKLRRSVMLEHSAARLIGSLMPFFCGGQEFPLRVRGRMIQFAESSSNGSIPPLDFLLEPISLAPDEVRGSRAIQQAQLPLYEGIRLGRTAVAMQSALCDAPSRPISNAPCVMRMVFRRGLPSQDKRQRFADITPEDFDAMMSVNLRHAVFAAQLVVPHMRELGSGSIVNTSSVAWMRGIEDLQLYSTAKAAAIGLTNSLARELGRDRIRVNAIAPGFVVTERQRALWFDDSAIDGVKQRQCLPDIIEPDDIANAALFLCSDSARMITKHCLVVHAGSL